MTRRQQPLRAFPHGYREGKRWGFSPPFRIPPLFSTGQNIKSLRCKSTTHSTKCRELARQPKLQVSRRKYSKANERVDSRLIATHRNQELQIEHYTAGADGEAVRGAMKKRRRKLAFSCVSSDACRLRGTPAGTYLFPYQGKSFWGLSRDFFQKAP